MGFAIGSIAVYLIVLTYFLLHMLQQLRTLTYQANKINNVLVRLQVQITDSFQATVQACS